MAVRVVEHHEFQHGDRSDAMSTGTTAAVGFVYGGIGHHGATNKIVGSDGSRDGESQYTSSSSEMLDDDHSSVFVPMIIRHGNQHVFDSAEHDFSVSELDKEDDGFYRESSQPPHFRYEGTVSLASELVAQADQVFENPEQYEQAANLYRQAANLYKSIGHYKEAAELYEKVGEIDIAVTLHEKAAELSLGIAPSVMSDDIKIECYETAYTCFAKAGNAEKAIKLYHETLKLLGKNINHQVEAELYQVAAHVTIQLGDVDGAVILYEKAGCFYELAALQATRNEEKAKLYEAAAACYMRTTNIDKVKETFNKLSVVNQNHAKEAEVSRDNAKVLLHAANMEQDPRQKAYLLVKAGVMLTADDHDLFSQFTNILKLCDPSHVSTAVHDIVIGSVEIISDIVKQILVQVLLEAVKQFDGTSLTQLQQELHKTHMKLQQEEGKLNLRPLQVKVIQLKGLLSDLQAQQAEDPDFAESFEAEIQKVEKMLNTTEHELLQAQQPLRPLQDAVTQQKEEIEKLERKSSMLNALITASIKLLPDGLDSIQLILQIYTPIKHQMTGDTQKVVVQHVLQAADTWPQLVDEDILYNVTEVLLFQRFKLDQHTQISVIHFLLRHVVSLQGHQLSRYVNLARTLGRELFLVKNLLSGEEQKLVAEFLLNIVDQIDGQDINRKLKGELLVRAVNILPDSTEDAQISARLKAYDNYANDIYNFAKRESDYKNWHAVAELFRIFGDEDEAVLAKEKAQVLQHHSISWSQRITEITTSYAHSAIQSQQQGEMQKAAVIYEKIIKLFNQYDEFGELYKIKLLVRILNDFNPSEFDSLYRSAFFTLSTIVGYQGGGYSTRRGAAELYNVVGSKCIELGDVKSAATVQVISAKLFLELKSFNRAYQALQNIKDHLYLVGEQLLKMVGYANAQSLVIQMATLLLENAKPQQAYYIFNGLGKVLSAKGRYEEATGLWKKAEVVFLSTEPVVSGLGGIGVRFEDQKLPHGSQLIDVREQICLNLELSGKTLEAAQGYSALGKNLQDIQDFVKSAIAYHKAGDLFLKANSDLDAVQTYSQASTLYARLGGSATRKDTRKNPHKIAKYYELAESTALLAMGVLQKLSFDSSTPADIRLSMSEEVGVLKEQANLYRMKKDQYVALELQHYAHYLESGTNNATERAACYATIADRYFSVSEYYYERRSGGVEVSRLADSYYFKAIEFYKLAIKVKGLSKEDLLAITNKYNVIRDYVKLRTNNSRSATNWHICGQQLVKLGFYNEAIYALFQSVKLNAVIEGGNIDNAASAILALARCLDPAHRSGNNMDITLVTTQLTNLLKTLQNKNWNRYKKLVDAVSREIELPEDMMVVNLILQLEQQQINSLVQQQLKKEEFEKLIRQSKQVYDLLVDVQIVDGERQRTLNWDVVQKHQHFEDLERDLQRSIINFQRKYTVRTIMSQSYPNSTYGTN